MSSTTPLITFYHYAYSPYARRIQWYLALRGLPYSECIQPPTLPRPDLARLGVRHRRIPVLAIDRDVYLDTRLILRKLEAIPGSDTVKPPLGVDSAGPPELLALERLLDILTVDTNVFMDAARLIPANVPAMKDPAFGRDRADFFGTPMGASPSKPKPKPKPSSKSSTPPASKALVRAESLAEIRHAAAILETSLLADGRSWILNTPAPSLADIESIWPFHWLTTMPGAFEDGASPQPALTPAQFPRLFAWIERFNAALKATRASQKSEKKRVDGAQAAEAIWAAKANDSAEGVDGSDPVARAAGLEVGQPCVVWPIDTGTLHKDVGRLVRLAGDEVVVEVSAAEPASGSAQSVYLHAPRHMFRVRPQAEAAATESKL